MSGHHKTDKDSILPVLLSVGGCVLHSVGHIGGHEGIFDVSMAINTG